MELTLTSFVISFKASLLKSLFLAGGLAALRLENDKLLPAIIFSAEIVGFLLLAMILVLDLFMGAILGFYHCR